jgi:hypothetical protein
VQDEAELGVYTTVKVDDAIDRERVSFKQMDAMCMAPALGEFDVVVLSNVLEHLISPMACLGRLGGRQGVVRVGGLALVASSFEWYVGRGVDEDAETRVNPGRHLRTTVAATVRRVVSEHEAVVERPWLHAGYCPCGGGDVNRDTSILSIHIWGVHQGCWEAFCDTGLGSASDGCG